MKSMFSPTGAELLVSLIFAIIVSVSLLIGAFVFHIHEAFTVLTDFIPVYIIAFLVVLILYEVNEFLTK